MRRFENKWMAPELSTRYALDEPHFSGGREALRNREGKI